MTEQKYTIESLNGKIEWEGGIEAAMEYGIRADDIEDETLGDLWYEATQQWAIFDHLRDEIEDYIKEKLK